MIHNAGGIFEFVDCIDFKFGKMFIRSLNDLLYDIDDSAMKSSFPCIKSVDRSRHQKSRALPKNSDLNNNDISTLKNGYIKLEQNTIENIQNQTYG